MKTTASWHATTRHFTLSAGFLASALVQTGCLSSTTGRDEELAADDDDIDEIQVVACADQEADPQPDCDASFAGAFESQPIVTPLVVETHDRAEKVRAAPRRTVARAGRVPAPVANARLAAAADELAAAEDAAAIVVVALADEPVRARRAKHAGPRDPAVESLGASLPPSLMSPTTYRYAAPSMGGSGSVLY